MEEVQVLFILFVHAVLVCSRLCASASKGTICEEVSEIQTLDPVRHAFPRVGLKSLTRASVGPAYKAFFLREEAVNAPVLPSLKRTNLHIALHSCLSELERVGIRLHADVCLIWDSLYVMIHMVSARRTSDYRFVRTTSNSATSIFVFRGILSVNWTEGELGLEPRRFEAEFSRFSRMQGGCKIHMHLIPIE